VLGLSTVLAPVAVYAVMGDGAQAMLGGWRKWLADNNAVVTVLLLLVFAVVLIGKGITGLSACRDSGTADHVVRVPERRRAGHDC
jgi:hypothetical protein